MVALDDAQNSSHHVATAFHKERKVRDVGEEILRCPCVRRLKLPFKAFLRRSSGAHLGPLSSNIVNKI
jgi:hypothetical protein